MMKTVGNKWVELFTTEEGETWEVSIDTEDLEIDLRRWTPSKLSYDTVSVAELTHEIWNIAQSKEDIDYRTREAFFTLIFDYDGYFIRKQAVIPQSSNQTGVYRELARLIAYEVVLTGLKKLENRYE